jgi:hypothetical protein
MIEIPRTIEELPWNRREAYGRAICAYTRPLKPETVSLADVDRFMKTFSWDRLYFALEALLTPVPPSGEQFHLLSLRKNNVSDR